MMKKNSFFKLLQSVYIIVRIVEFVIGCLG